MELTRASGILLHPTALPSEYGIGDFGSAARRFVDFLVESKQSVWQVLPLGPTGYGDSPYQALSAFAGNTMMISPEAMVEDGLLSPDDLTGIMQPNTGRVNFSQARQLKRDLFARAYSSFVEKKNSPLRTAFDDFCDGHSRWLDDFALYLVLKNANGGAPWFEWSAALRHRDDEEIDRQKNLLSAEIDQQKFLQFVFFRQWQSLRTYCEERGVKIIGDLPIFVAHDSADVWTNRGLFKLDLEGMPRFIAGVPPDYFSRTGQRWGNPVYNWTRVQAEGFDWWLRRARASFDLFDVVRLDHFRGFVACWEVPGADETAEHGSWVDAPGRELFARIRTSIGDLPIIAEDLGHITPEVDALRDEFGFPGMRIFQYGFGGDARNSHLPHNYTRNAVAYTGTHDNDTIVGWFNSVAGFGSTRDSGEISREHEYCLKYLDTDGREIHWAFIRALLASVANTVILPIQDVLGLDSNARLNTPATAEGNWSWRVGDDQLTKEITERLGELSTIYGRANQ